MENALKNMVADKKSETLQKNKEGTIEMKLINIKSKSGIKKYLTTRTNFGYSESLKLIHRLSHPIDMRFFCIPMGLMRARNILNTSRPNVSGLVSQSLPHFVRDFLKRIHKMTNTIIKKINELNKLLGKVYENTDSVSVAMRCSEIRKELAQLSAEIKGNANG